MRVGCEKKEKATPRWLNGETGLGGRGIKSFV